ncbi:MAG: VOC family protein [Acidimicrobiales bacterium]
MQPLALHHVSINVTDADLAVTFYTEVLGGTLRTDRPDFGFGGAWIDLGTSQVHRSRDLSSPCPRLLC